MNAKTLFCLFVSVLLAASLPAVAQPGKRKAKTPPRPTTPPPAPDFQTLLQQAQAAAEQAQAEVRRSREQNEALQKQLATNTEELARLRETILTFGAQLAALKITEPKAAREQAAASVPAPTHSPALATLTSEVETLKEQVEVHSAQIKEHAQTKVESDSKFRVKLHGMLLANTYLNTNDSSLTDVPLYAAEPGYVLRRNNLGATLRQSRIGFTMDGPRLSPAWGEARLSAEAEFDFWGGESSAVLGQFRIVTASARLDWDKTSFIVGQRPPLISPRNPTSLAAVWFAPFHQAGNLWQWRPQIMVEHRVKAGESSELQLQGGVLMPFGESVQGHVLEGGAGYQSRAVWSHNLDDERKLEFGVGGYFHRRPFVLERKVNSNALTTDWQIPLGTRFELSGEAFWGRAINLGEASGFRNDRLYAVTGSLYNAATQIRGVFSTGGWAQLNYKARADLDFNLAYGQEDPRNRDLRFGVFSSSTRFKNQAAFANFIYTLRQNFLVSLEYRRFWTDYSSSRQRAGHYNLAFGYMF
jgi:flagellar biosynthesis chaperone FliJ